MRARQISDEPADLLRREKFTGALALALGEFPQEIFVGAAEKIGFNIVKTEPIPRIGELFYNSAQSLIAYFAFAAARFVEINNVDYAAQRWICFNDRTDSRRELLAKRFWLLIVRPIKLLAPAHNWPTRLRRNVKPNKRMISFENFERDFLRPVS